MSATPRFLERLAALYYLLVERWLRVPAGVDRDPDAKA